jgi:histidinol-phosphatase
VSLDRDLAVRYDVRSELDFAIDLADRADELTMAAFTGDPLPFTTKPDGSPVTEADRHVEQVLRSLIAASRSGDGFLGEESSAPTDGRGRRWIVDPIDGTRRFVAGGRGWATQIALEVDATIVVGVTSAPALGSRWWGARDLGATSRTPGAGEQRLFTTTTSSLAAARWSSHPPMQALSGSWRELADRLADRRRYVEPTTHGALMVAEGSLDVCLQLEGAPWDYAAFASVVQAAGGAFSYLDGSSILSGVRPAIFSNGMVHQAALDAIRVNEE